MVMFQIKYVLRHELLIRPKEFKTVVIIEDIYDEIVRQELVKKDSISEHRT